MKRILLRTLLGLGVLIALIVIIFTFYGIKAKSETKKMTPAETGQLTDSIFTIKDSFVNLYFIKIDENYIAIDAGNSIDGVRAGLYKLQICPENVIGIFLTHTDGDHIKGLSLFSKAKIYISKQEEQMINGKTSRFLIFKNSLGGRPYNVLEDNQIFTLFNFKIQGILVPGHTPGSMCYIVNNKYLFTGDALSLKNGKIDRFNKFFNMDSEQAAKSIDRLINLPNVQYIFTAHYGFTNDYKNAVSNWEK